MLHIGFHLRFYPFFCDRHSRRRRLVVEDSSSETASSHFHSMRSAMHYLNKLNVDS